MKQTVKTNTLKTIPNIAIITDCKINLKEDYNNYLVIEIKGKPFLIYNLSQGQDYSFKQKCQIKLFMGKSKVNILYNQNEDFQDDLDFSTLKTITLYKNTNLINTYTNQKTQKSNYLELKDINNQSFYLDIKHNKLYKRNNIYKIEKTKEIPIYQTNIKIKKIPKF